MSGATSMLRLLARQPALAIWALYIAAAPFYIVHNGLPQPGDVLIALLFPVAMSGWKGRLHPASVRVFRALLWFTLWVCFVDVFWCLVLRNFTLDLLFPVYYVYNAAIVLSALVLYNRYSDQFLRVTVFTVYVSVLFQVVASFALVGGGLRNKLFFSNPNQLGYYALLAGCVIALTHKRLGFTMLRSSIALTGCAYLAVLSASRSAAAGVVLLFLLLVFASPRLLIGATVVGMLLMLVGGGKATESLQTRVEEQRNTNLTFFEQRGYDRIWNNKEYLVFGAGEGANNRFVETTAIKNAEIHSSAGTIIFCYGVVGTLLFGMFLWRLMQGSSLRTSLMLAPPGIYAFAHQGLRFTSLWILIAVFIALKSRGTPAHV